MHHEMFVTGAELVWRVEKAIGICDVTDSLQRLSKWLYLDGFAITIFGITCLDVLYNKTSHCVCALKVNRVNFECIAWKGAKWQKQ